MPDPFTLLYDKLWEAVEGDAALSQLVLQNNRINFNKSTAPYNFNPENRSIHPGNSPELTLLPDMFDANFTSSNKTSGVTRAMTWSIRCDSKVLHKELFPVEWALFSCMARNLKDFQSIQYQSKRFVLNGKILMGSATVPDVDESSRKPFLVGWRSLWTLEFDLEFDHSVL